MQGRLNSYRALFVVVQWCHFLNCSRLRLRKFRVFLALPFSGVFLYCCACVLWDLSQAQHVLPPRLRSAHSNLLLWAFCIAEQLQQLLFHTAWPEILTPMFLAGLSAVPWPVQDRNRILISSKGCGKTHYLLFRITSHGKPLEITP